MLYISLLFAIILPVLLSEQASIKRLARKNKDYDEKKAMKRNNYMLLCTVFSYIFLAMLFAFYDIMTSRPNGAELSAKYGWVYFAAAGVFFAILIFNSPGNTAARGEKKEIADAKRERYLSYAEKYERKEWSHGYIHLYGMDIPEKSKCELWLCENCLIIYFNIPFVLDYSKIIAAEVMSKTEITTRRVDKKLAPLAGGLLLGIPGIILMGGTKEVKDVEETFYLTITYRSYGEVKYIIFDVTSNKYIAKKTAQMINNIVSSDIDDAVEL